MQPHWNLTPMLLVTVFTALAPGTFAPASSGATSAPRVLLVTESSGTEVEAFRAGLREVLEGSGGGPDLRAASPEELTAGLSESPALILAVGEGAIAEARRSRPGTRVLPCLVPGREVGDSGVALDLPPALQFDWIRRVLPRVRRVGMLHGPDTPEENLATIREGAEAAGLRLEVQLVREARSLPRVLERLEDSIDVLWVTLDDTVYTPSAARRVLLFSYRHRIPLVGPSRPWARAGALMALDRDYQDLGRQAGELAIQVLSAPPEAPLPPPVRPRRARLYLNDRARHKLRVGFAPEAEPHAAEVFR